MCTLFDYIYWRSSQVLFFFFFFDKFSNTFCWWILVVYIKLRKRKSSFKKRICVLSAVKKENEDNKQQDYVDISSPQNTVIICTSLPVSINHNFTPIKKMLLWMTDGFLGCLMLKMVAARCKFWIQIFEPFWFMAPAFLTWDLQWQLYYNCLGYIFSKVFLSIYYFSKNKYFVNQ